MPVSVLYGGDVSNPERPWQGSPKHLKRSLGAVFSFLGLLAALPNLAILPCLSVPTTLLCTSVFVYGVTAQESFVPLVDEA